MIDPKPSEYIQPWKTLIRMAALTAVFLISGLLFWKHSDRSMQILLDKQSLEDAGGLLDEKDKKSLQKLLSEIRSNYGLNTRILITDKKFEPVENQKNSLFLGLNPKKNRCIIKAPPLVDKALGKDFFQQSKHALLKHCRNGTWTNGLFAFLESLNTEMEAVYVPQNP